ncbi:DUF2637 domain-containing protein [Micromonospora globbae]|uniref:DUF2637 domain-containing protein n=1 Tax=Micromonospora globbae TaxID=1894969 RepID=UPI0034488766
MAGGTRAVRNISAGAVAAIAAWSSYSHTVHVALTFGERPEVAYALPFSVDGMLVVASVVMVDDKRRNHRVRPVARVAFAAGVLASVVANIAAAHPSVGARIVAAWPAVALLLVVEMLARPPASAGPEVPPVTAAHIAPAAEAVGAASAAAEAVVTELPPMLAPARSAAVAPPPDVDGQPPITAHRPHPPRTEPVTQAPTNPAAETADGGARRLPAATARVPRPALHPPLAAVPPPAVVPPTVVPPTGVADVPPELPQQRREHGGLRAAEPTGTPVNRDRRVEPPPQTAARRRRPAAATRQLARQIIDAEPHLSRSEVAARLGLSTRRLREVLATPA